MATKRQRNKRRSLRLEAAAAPSGPLMLEGDHPIEFAAASGEGDAKKLPTFKMTAYTGGKMKPRGFSIPVVADLATAKVASGTRPIFLQHDPGQIVGHGDITVNQQSITVEGVMSGVGTAADQVKLSAGNGFPWKSSIGADVGKLDFVEAGKQIEVNGRKFNGPLYVARNIEVYETSFVSLAGDNRSSATVAATLGDSTMNFETWLQAKGIELATLSAAGKASLQAMFDAEMKAKETPEGDEEDDEEDPVAALRASHAAEIVRVKGIKKVIAAFPDVKFKAAGGVEVDLEAHAVAENWTADATELYAMRSARPAAAIHSRSHEADCDTQTLQAAMMLNSGLALDNKVWGTMQAVAMNLPAWMRRGLNDDARQKAMEAAHRFSAMSFVDFCREAVRLDGKQLSSNRKEVIQAAFSGSALSSIFTTSVNARLLVKYLETRDTTPDWTSETDVPDFKQNDRMTLAKGGGLDRLPRGSTANHMSRSDRSEAYKIARYAKQFVVDEQDAIDDNKQAIKDMPDEMGLAAGRLRPDLVYAILFANAALVDTVALFHSTHSNTDTSAALAAATLKTGITKVGLQTDNGVNLNLSPSHLIVPKTLDFTSKELINSSLIVITGSTDSARGNENVLKAALQIVSDSRLDNGVTDPSTGTVYSGDTNDWFLAVSPANGGKTIEVGYLEGTGRVPQVRSFTLDRGQWGMGWDVKMDIGAKSLDYRSMYRGQG
jgi:hypothetical protein